MSALNIIMKAFDLIDRFFKRWIVYSIIGLALWGLWVGLELLQYGEIQPREVDNVMGCILWLSLMSNYDHWIEKKERGQ